ncbi:Na+/H+ antiporter NhaA [Agarilytica rhodophyticola]|uniref:Na+/H+ antiporter NhaA n=1 Tax=Agarilytica rhodophyticola TaxID=1737490 RepID=UPI000B349845|nr:Na+/H+ antiporter NhaA [Agarilytica rhodophyticola]
MIKVLKEKFQHDASGGVLLAIAAVAALILANSPAHDFYQGVLEIPVVVAAGDFEIAKPLLLWVNDGMMALFFLLVGLEIKRELLNGHLSSLDQIVLPGIAAIAGIIFPAVIFSAFNYNDPIAIKGWAIPSATDIAFAIGVFTLFGSRLPITLKLFLLTVAIFDDIGAIVIIALFYSQELSTASLAIAFCGLLGLLILNRLSINSVAAYILLGTVVWAAVLKSGVHATLAGFLIAWFIPLKQLNKHGKPMLPALEQELYPWVSFLILPTFAFANAGVSFINTSVAELLNPITVGIALGLFVGKQVGIFGLCWIVVKSKLAVLPKGATWVQLYGVSLLCGIGFTMSLFIGTLAFENQDLSYLASVKIGVLLGSLASAVLGGWIIAKAKTNKLKTNKLTP